MNQTIDEKNKALVLKAFDTLFVRLFDRLIHCYPPSRTGVPRT